MDARTRSKVTLKYKTKYRVKNWAAYEAALRKRGDVTLWFFRGGYRRLACASALAASAATRTSPS